MVRKTVLFFLSYILFVFNVFAQETKKLSYQIIDLENNTYGYSIHCGNKVYITQTTIPALLGNEGFKTKVQAKKTAELIIRKISAGIKPPTLTRSEIQNIIEN